MGLVIMRNYSIKLGGEATRGSVFALALTEWGSISPERVARAAKQALCGVNPFRFKKKRLRGPYSNEVAFESGMKWPAEPS